ncbi:MAG: TRAP transporter substrate-binding protein DctP [Dehalococcoidia bacterium]
MKNLKLTLTLLMGLTLVMALLFIGCNKTEPAPAPSTPQTPSTPSTPATEEPIELTFATPWADPNAYAVAAQEWINKIESDANGRVKITPYWGGTLINPMEAFSQLSEGVFDIGWCCIGYTATGFELSTNYMPFYYGISDRDLRRKIDTEVRAKFPELNEEYAKWKILETVSGNNNQLVSIKPVRTVADIKGMAMKGGGPDIEVIKKLGGEGARVSMGEVYISLQKGILDGSFVPWEAVGTFKFYEVADYVTLLDFSYSPYPQNFMNMDVWNSLPPDIQQIFDDNIEFWNNAEDEAFRLANDVGLIAAEEAGMEMITFSDEESEKFFGTYNEVCTEIATKLDGEGYHGTDILNEVLSLAEKYQ